MLAFHTMKRAREDDADMDDERYLTKSRPWSFQVTHNGQRSRCSPPSLSSRPSLTPSPPRTVPPLEVVSPAHSDRSEDASPASFVGDDLAGPEVEVDMDVAMDVDDDDLDIIGSQPPDSPFVQTAFRNGFLQPAKLNSDLFSRESPFNGTGRIPTPIYPTFSASRGSMNAGSLGNAHAGSSYLGVPCNPMLQLAPAAARKQSHAEQDRSHRMPSPISEDDDVPDTPTALTQSRLSRLSVTTYHHEQPMDVEAAAGAQDAASTPTRGRKRSGALSGRGKFCMGYRDDCDKCRQRVPGHYSHFLP